VVDTEGSGVAPEGMYARVSPDVAGAPSGLRLAPEPVCFFNLTPEPVCFFNLTPEPVCFFNLTPEPVCFAGHLRGPWVNTDIVGTVSASVDARVDRRRRPKLVWVVDDLRSLVVFGLLFRCGHAHMFAA
jgi:hypothetical protein